MSDLQCPATLYVARHAETEYETSLLTDDGGSLTLAGREQARALGESLVESRLALIYTSALSRAVQTAEIVAARTGASVSVREGLREWSFGDRLGEGYDPAVFEPVFAAWGAGRHDERIPGGESGTEIRTRVRVELEAIADLHRGETVLVVSHTGAIQTAVPPMLGLPDGFAATHPVPHCGVVEVVADADGWVLRSWAGEPAGMPGSPDRTEIRDSGAL